MTQQEIDPRLLKILFYPNPKLKGICAEVIPGHNWDNIKKLVEMMQYTLKFYGGLGLAAPQVGVHYKIFVISLQDFAFNEEPGLVSARSTSLKQYTYAMINPEIIETSGKEVEEEEACFSLPGVSGMVSRPSEVKVSFLDLEGKRNLVEAQGLLARCILHEEEHLRGVLYVDKMPPGLKKDMFLKKYKKLRGLNENKRVN